MLLTKPKHILKYSSAEEKIALYVGRPYPTEQDKMDLARLAGITVLQVPCSLPSVPPLLWFLCPAASLWHQALLRASDRKNLIQHRPKYPRPKLATARLGWRYETADCCLSTSDCLALLQVNNWFVNARKRLWQPLL